MTVDKLLCRLAIVVPQIVFVALWPSIILFTSIYTDVERNVKRCNRYITIAGAVVHFYWTKGEREKMPRFPVGLALKNTIRYAKSVLHFHQTVVSAIDNLAAL